MNHMPHTARLDKATNNSQGCHSVVHMQLAHVTLSSWYNAALGHNLAKCVAIVQGKVK